MPAVRDSFWLLARLPFRQHIRPGVCIGCQCLRGFPSDSRASNEKRPRESTLSRTRNICAGVRGPPAVQNVPRELRPDLGSGGRGPASKRHDKSNAGLSPVGAITSLNERYGQLRAKPRGPVGPRAGLRQNWSPNRVPAARNRGAGGGGTAASGCMFFTNVAVEKRYEFFWKNP